MGKFKSSSRKILVSLAGFPLIVLGIILIPLPGPGILVILLGLLVLSIEFDWAKRHRDRLNEMRKNALEKARAQKEKAKQEK
jgi:uncharacterized protein (TIGR02611 family)